MLIQDTADLKEITSCALLLSDRPICSYQILGCILGCNLAWKSKVILMWDFGILCTVSSKCTYNSNLDEVYEEHQKF